MTKQRRDDEVTLELNVEVTQTDIDEAVRLGLSGEELMERAIERALRKKEQH